MDKMPKQYEPVPATLARVEQKLDDILPLVAKHETRLDAHDEEFKNVRRSIGKLAVRVVGATSFVAGVVWLLDFLINKK
jgi:hypothetical protein